MNIETTQSNSATQKKDKHGLIRIIVSQFFEILVVIALFVFEIRFLVSNMNYNLPLIERIFNYTFILLVP
jgi:hypothetical protein